MENDLLPGAELLDENEFFEKIIRENKLDFTKPARKPDTIIEIKSGGQYQRLFTLSNFSAITGKSKAKKTFLLSLITACAVGGCEIQGFFKSNITNRKDVYHFDTEQGDWDCYNTGSRVNILLGKVQENYHFFCLREFNPDQRVKIIEYILEKQKETISFVVIDGVADLLYDINDLTESTKVITYLMKWTKIYNIHICLAIHENWGNDKATGHIGTFVLKKAESVISVSKHDEDKRISKVKNTYQRGVADFDDFEIIIDNGLPYIHDENYLIRKDNNNIQLITKINPELEPIEDSDYSEREPKF